jgi:ComF family protein
MYNLFNKVCENIINLLFPNKCIICEKYGLLLCHDCFSNIEKVLTSICPECGRISVNSRFCARCRNKNNRYIYSVHIATSYQSPIIKELIKSFKYHGLTGLSEICGELIHQRIKNIDIPNNTVIVPVPLHQLKYNRRGFNQSELIARYLSKRLQIPGADALSRIKNTTNQVKLQRSARIENMQNVFECHDPDFVAGKNILLVDDVFTTGATLGECARMLKLAGAKKIYGAVVTRNI